MLTKYLIAGISYQGLHRVETLPYPEAALREALVNAIVHKDYSTGNPIQISVYKDKVILWNAGVLPENWTVERLKEKHPSVPFNPVMANAFFRAGLIEAWGRGTLKIIEQCRMFDISEPVFKYDLSGFWIEFEKGVGETSGKRRGNVGETSGEIIELIKINARATIPEMTEKIGVTQRTIERNLQKLQRLGLLERIGGAKGGYWKIIRPDFS